MAEGIVNALHGDEFEAFSAGTSPGNVNPYAIKALAEIGIDISRHRSKGIEEFKDRSFDYVITLCDSARESCPFFAGGGKRIHKGFEDPSAIKGTDEEILSGFRRIQNEIKAWLETDFLSGADCATK
jgi:arsenate reductase